MKATIEINKIKEALKVISDFNALQLHDIILTENGKEVDIDMNVLADFEYCGLSNKEYINSEIYKLKNSLYESSDNILK